MKDIGGFDKLLMFSKLCLDQPSHMEEKLKNATNAESVQKSIIFWMIIMSNIFCCFVDKFVIGHCWFVYDSCLLELFTTFSRACYKHVRKKNFLVVTFASLAVYNGQSSVVVPRSTISAIPPQIHFQNFTPVFNINNKSEETVHWDKHRWKRSFYKMAVNSQVQAQCNCKKKK